MRSRCIFCNNKIMNKATICFSCRAKGPHGLNEYPEAMNHCCKGKNFQGKPCQKWAKEGKLYCTYHKSQFKEENK